MVNLRDALSIGHRIEGWRKLLRVLDRGHAGGAVKGRARLRELFGFGSNPGNLRMFSYQPPALADNPALVVVLHGCTRTAVVPCCTPLISPSRTATCAP